MGIGIRHAPRRERARQRIGALVGTALVASLLVPPAGAAPGQAAKSSVGDTVDIATSALGAPPSATAVQLVRETADSTSTVLIARDDSFADALASGALQDEAVLLLVPGAGPLPPEVRAVIADLRASRAVVLGGDAAVSPVVVQELQALGLVVERRAGGSRIETAVAIASDRPAATTAILARAFAAEGGSPTQGFADALAGGGLAASTGWPVLLTASDALSPATRAHLRSSAIEQVLVLGGTAAIGPAVEEELQALGLDVQRIAGDDRFGTAVAVARARGADSAADVARVVLVDGTTEDAWVAGFAAAAHSARLGAPIVLAAPGQLPPATRQWLDGAATRSARSDADGVRLTCAVERVACEQARVALGLPPRAAITYDPASGPLPPGAVVRITATGTAEAITVGGTCAPTPATLPPGGGEVRRGTGAGEGPCTLVVDAVLPDGTAQREVVDFAAAPSGPLLLMPGTCTGFADPAVSADGSTAAVLVTGAAGCDVVASGSGMAFADVADGSVAVLPAPEGLQRSTFDGDVILSPDGRVALVDLEVPGDVASRTPWVFDRGAGTVRSLASTNPALVDPGEVITGHRDAWTADGRVLGRYCGQQGCGQAIDPVTGQLSAFGNACGAWWGADPQGVICDLGTISALGASGIAFAGTRMDGSAVEVDVDLGTGAVRVVPTACRPTPPGAGASLAGGDVIRRACRTGFGTEEMSLVVTSVATGASRVAATHVLPSAPLPLQVGAGDDRWVPLRYAIGDGATGRGELHDLVAGQHVDLGPVRGVPQLHASGSFVVVATDAGLERRPVVLAP